MDPAPAGVVLARHAGIDEKTGQLAADEDGGPRQLVVSSDFYSVYTSAAKGRRPDQPQPPLADEPVPGEAAGQQPTTRSR